MLNITRLAVETRKKHIQFSACLPPTIAVAEPYEAQLELKSLIYVPKDKRGCLKELGIKTRKVIGMQK